MVFIIARAGKIEHIICYLLIIDAGFSTGPLITGHKWVTAIPCKLHNNSEFQVEILPEMWCWVCSGSPEPFSWAPVSFCFSMDGSLQFGPHRAVGSWTSPTPGFCQSCFSSPVLFILHITFLVWKYSQDFRKPFEMRTRYRVWGRGMKQHVSLGLLRLCIYFGPTWIEDLCFWGRKGDLLGLYGLLPCSNFCWYRLPCADSFLPFAVSWCFSLLAWLAGMWEVGGLWGMGEVIFALLWKALVSWSSREALLKLPSTSRHKLEAVFNAAKQMGKLKWCFRER